VPSTKEDDWKSAWTLEDYVISLIKKGETDSAEFKALKEIYGRERMVAIWKKYKDATRN